MQKIRCVLNPERCQVLAHTEKLPVEILAHIFNLCVDAAELSSAGTKREQAIMLPWILSSVCPSWRSIALAMPSIWSIVIIDTMQYSRRPESYISHAQERLRLQLTRSKECALEIGIFQGYTAMGDGPDPKQRGIGIAEPLWSALFPHFHRIHTLDVCDDLDHTFLRRAKSSLLSSTHYPFLRELRWHSHSYAPFYINLFLNAPRLRHLHLGRGLAINPSRLPLLQVTEISLDRLYFGLLLQNVLPYLASVKTLCVRKTAMSDFTAQPERSVLSNLQHLSLGRSRDLWTLQPGISGVIGLHSAPALQDLAIEEISNDMELGLLSQFFTRSTCPLASFVAKVIYNLPLASFEKLFISIPTITSLDMQFVSHRSLNAVMGLLAQTSPSGSSAPHARPRLCPALHSIRLVISAVDRNGVDRKAIADIAQNRQNHGLTMVGIWCRENETSDDELLSWLSPVVD